ncbi:MAG TPA: 3'(2'),5'-bisphosphate nucleotidase CysQ [Xanthobacteraceae bacterium]
MPAIEVADPAQIIATLTAHVREAGTLALSMSQRPLKNWTKEGSSVVCEADVAVDDLLRLRLTAEGEGFGWLSEESVDDPARLSARYVWIVDPIDGTRAYLAGLADWSVSAALVENGRPIAACLYAPVTAELFAAAAGAGVTLNGTAIAATAGAALTNARVAGPNNFLAQLAKITPPFTVVPRVHSLALRLARVAQGTIDIAVASANSYDWDLAAADLLVHEAGGALTPFGGGVVIYNRSVPRHGALVAAGRERHATLIEILRDERLASS